VTNYGVGTTEYMRGITRWLRRHLECGQHDDPQAGVARHAILQIAAGSVIAAGLVAEPADREILRLVDRPPRRCERHLIRWRSDAVMPKKDYGGKAVSASTAQDGFRSFPLALKSAREWF
jgi:hypothetical protein